MRSIYAPLGIDVMSIVCTFVLCPCICITNAPFNPYISILSLRISELSMVTDEVAYVGYALNTSALSFLISITALVPLWIGAAVLSVSFVIRLLDEAYTARTRYCKFWGLCLVTYVHTALVCSGPSWRPKAKLFVQSRKYLECGLLPRPASCPSLRYNTYLPLPSNRCH